MKTKAIGMLAFIGLAFTLVFACSTDENNSETPNEIAEITAAEATQQKVVFIAGYDKGSQTFYSEAKKYFQSKNYKIVDDAFSLQEIITWLNKNHNDNNYDEIHIVNKGNSQQGLSLETTIHGELLSQASLLKCLKENKLPKLNNVLTENSKLVFHTSELGKNKNLLQVLKQTFTANYKPKVFASPHASVFNGQFQKHYLAKVFYGYYPTAQSPGNVDLSKQFIRKYPYEDINWLDAIRTSEEEEPGKEFAYKFNIPIRWEITFEKGEKAPKLEDAYAIMDWIEANEKYANILASYDIPLEKFRWRSATVGNKLIIKGKSTAVCILKPMMQRNNPLSYVRTDFDNLRYYTQL